MRFFSSELGQSYSSYSFAYCNYALAEPGDTLGEIYNLGYLPYSGAKGVRDIFYLARSLRVVLADWDLNSENRRVLGKFEHISSQTIPKRKFDYHDPNFVQFCLDYFADRHGANIMPRERLLHFLDLNLVTDIVEYTKDGHLLGYVFEASDTTITHYPYSFYDLAYVNQSLGMWMMIDSVKRAKEQGKSFMYLGTAYGSKGLYKTNFSNTEFWNGRTWVADREQLRQRCKTDDERTLVLIDEWKGSFIDAHFSAP